MRCGAVEGWLWPRCVGEKEHLYRRGARGKEAETGSTQEVHWDGRSLADWPGVECAGARGDPSRESWKRVQHFMWEVDLEANHLQSRRWPRLSCGDESEKKIECGSLALVVPSETSTNPPPCLSVSPSLQLETPRWVLRQLIPFPSPVVIQDGHDICCSTRVLTVCLKIGVASN